MSMLVPRFALVCLSSVPTETRKKMVRGARTSPFHPSINSLWGRNGGPGSSSAVISVGKQRKGQRLRQRHWLTSSLFWNVSHDCEASSTSSSSCPTGTRSRTSSITSHEEATSSLVGNERILIGQSQAWILAEMTGTIAVSLVKKTPDSSWGVQLAKEGDMFVVNKAAPMTQQHGPILVRPHHYVNWRASVKAGWRNGATRFYFCGVVYTWRNIRQRQHVQ